MIQYPHMALQNNVHACFMECILEFFSYPIPTPLFFYLSLPESTQVFSVLFHFKKKKKGGNGGYLLN